MTQLCLYLHARVSGLSPEDCRNTEAGSAGLLGFSKAEGNPQECTDHVEFHIRADLGRSTQVV